MSASVRCSATPHLGGRLLHGPPVGSHTRRVVAAAPAVLNAFCLECLLSWMPVVLACFSSWRFQYVFGT